MDREQIIKALECISRTGDVLCDGCPYRKYDGLACHRIGALNALALIRELTEDIEQKDETIAGLIGTIKDAYGFAVREMKARLDKNLLAVKDHTGKICLVVLDSDINQIAKEML